MFVAEPFNVFSDCVSAVAEPIDPKFCFHPLRQPPAPNDASVGLMPDPVAVFKY